MSEAAFRSAAGDPAATPLRPSTPHNVSGSSPQDRHGCVQSEEGILRHTVQSDNGCFERMLPQLGTGSAQGDSTMSARSRIMRGVITGPARWRGSSVSCGTPSLYCAVYKYSFTQGVVNPSASSVRSSTESPESARLPLPPPTLVSSTWGQGPLVIEGVPVLERPAAAQDEGAKNESPCSADEVQPIFVLAVGVFRSRINASTTTPLFSPESLNHRKSASTPLPRPEDLLGVLHIPLHCVNITEKQQEVKLRLPVTHRSPTLRSHAVVAIQIEGEGERELAAVLSPATSLEALEKFFVDGLSVSTTGANRCNVMLFRLSGSGGPFLSTADAILQAALAAPAAPSVASTALQRSTNLCEPHDRGTSKQMHQCPNGSQVERNVVKAEVTLCDNETAQASSPNIAQLAQGGAVGICRHEALISHENRSDTADASAQWSRKDAAEQLMSPSRRQLGRADAAGSSGSVASNTLSKDQQRQRHQRRQQELSVAAVLAASAIAAAARGERDRSSRSSTTKQPQLSQQLVPALGLKGTQRPSSVCSLTALNRALMEQEVNDSLRLHSHNTNHERTQSLQEGWIPPAGKSAAYRTTDLGGEPELSPDDSVSVRGDETHRLATTLANRGAKSAHSVASCMLGGQAPLDCPVRLNSLSDDRKSTLTTSIRRLDCLMTRAQLLLSQRRHRRSQQGECQRAAPHESVHGVRTEQPETATTVQAAATTSSNNQSGTSDSSEPPATERRGSNHAVLANEVECPETASHQNCSAESTQPQGSSPDGPTHQGQSPDGVRDFSLISKAVDWLSAQAVRRKDLLIKKLVLHVWAQRAQLERHRRVIQALRLAKASESVSRSAAEQYGLLSLGWLSLRAHSAQRACQNQQEKQCQSTDKEEKNQQVGGNRCRENEQQVQELIQLVEGLQKQVQARDDWCKHLEKRSSEEQQRHTQELGALRRQIIELQDELKQKGRKDSGLPPSRAGDNESQRVQQELDKISQERRQLQLLAAEHAKAKACAEEEQMRLQNELAANQQRTRDLEHQLLLVDQQLVGILNQATAHGETPTGLAQLGPSPPLGTWALKKLQGMRETLRGIDGKEPLGRTTQARRQPPLEAATFAPLQKLSQDSSRHAEDVKGQAPSPTEQQQCLRVLCQQRPTTPQYPHPAHIAREAKASAPMNQPPESDLKKMQPQQQQAGPWINERREPSPMPYHGATVRDPLWISTFVAFLPGPTDA
ncbi:hypothetical protein, conserved [Eimeria brunetti]|uniref:Uncharacterized protein n=1 Tax=Eimeria brunetti TaxID=51314 RepID=U6LPW0_9EIME|nr:hypothetical protein, conserved [Eimeria brunetti]